MTVKVLDFTAEFGAEPRLYYETLGEEIIEMDSIALAEQIKNASDATPKNKTIIDLSRHKEGIITIQDSGLGMNKQEITEQWFNAGTSNKQQLNHLRGGKGIGRFSLFRIADLIEIETIKNGFQYNFKIEKSQLEQGNKKVKITEILIPDPTISGTKITLSSSNKRTNIKEIEIELENLNLPYTSKDFEVIYPNDFNKTEFLSPKEATKHAPFHLKVEFEGNKITKYHYKSVMKEHIFYETSDLPNEVPNLTVSNISLGKIKFQLTNFYLDSAFIKNFMDISKNDIQKLFLTAYHGINVYKNGFKIFGLAKEDWLKLAERRVSRGQGRIDNKLTFAFLMLSSENSISLIEKSNREGFLRSNELTYLKEMLIFIISLFEKDREISIANIKKFEIPKHESEVVKNDEVEKKKNSTDNHDGHDESDSIESTEHPTGIVVSDKTKILKIQRKTILEGDEVYLKDPDIIYSTYDGELQIIKETSCDISNHTFTSNNRKGTYKINYIISNNKETLEIKVNGKKINLSENKKDFFTSSNYFEGVVSFGGFDNLITQLKDLDYDSKYLLYIVSFRAIFEETVKRYLNKQQLNISGVLKNDMLAMLDNLKNILKTSGRNCDPFHQEKLKIHSIFKGYSALKNFLDLVDTKFRNENYDTFLHSLTHSPAKIDKSLALEIANDIILPLFVIEKMLTDAGIISVNTL